MSNNIHFTDEQKYRANNTDLADFLRRQGERLTRSGYKWRSAFFSGIIILSMTKQCSSS